MALSDKILADLTYAMDRAELIDLANACNRCLVALDNGEWT